MSVEFDSNPKFSQYAHPEVLVSTEWLQNHLHQDGLVIVESDEDVLLYQTGHIPGAVKIDWHTDLNDPVTRDYLDGEAFAKLLSSKGIARDTTVVIYGDNKNWWATYALWVFKLFGHPDVRILDGGREKWIAEDREITTEVTSVTPTIYPVIERDDKTIRAYRDDVLEHLGKPLVDVRSPQEYSGERTHMPSYPEEGALRGGHIPGAASVPWSKAISAMSLRPSRRSCTDWPLPNSSAPCHCPRTRRVVAASSGVNGRACRLVKMLSRPNMVMNQGSPAAGR